VTTLVLRLGAVLCLILALVGTQQREREDLLSVVFLLDVSDSVPLSQQVKGIERIHTAVDALKPIDAFSVLLFAGQASIRLPMQPKAEQGHLTPDILSDTAFNRDATNLASAIQLAMNIFPEERQKRMVLLSDGVQNVGEASEILDLVRASEIELFTIPLNSERGNEVWVRDLQLPPQVRSGETFRVRAIIESAVEAQVTAQLYRNRVLVIPAQPLSLKPGKQTVDFPQQLFDEGNYEYQLKLFVEPNPPPPFPAKEGGELPSPRRGGARGEVSPGDGFSDKRFVADSISENNTAYGFTRVHGRPHILYIEDAPEYAAPLKTVLEANRFAVQVISPSEFPTHPVGLQNSDVVVMSDVPADALSESQMEMIESYVRDVGKGLVVIGGGHAFGMGGYQDTPLERVLPLDMTPRQQKESLALMLVIDASGSMANYVGSDQKIQLAIEGVRAAIRALKDEDQVGVIGFDAKIKMEVPPRIDHASLLHKVGELTPGGGTKMYPALKRAYELLKGVDAKQKHIVLLSDGKSDGDFIPLAKQIAADKITVTAIAIGDATQELMKAIADAGEGNYTYVQNVSQLPRVFANEVRQTQKYMIQEPFQPVISEGGGAILAGIAQLPTLYGYIATSEKEHAEVYLRSPEEHPILAAWNYGLGRAVAFTSDVKPGWGADWIAWEKFGKFWGQVVNSVLPSADGNADFDLTVSHRNGRGQVVIERSSPSDLSPGPSPGGEGRIPPFPPGKGAGGLGGNLKTRKRPMSALHDQTVRENQLNCSASRRLGIKGTFPSVSPASTSSPRRKSGSEKSKVPASLRIPRIGT